MNNWASTSITVTYGPMCVIDFLTSPGKTGRVRQSLFDYMQPPRKDRNSPAWLNTATETRSSSVRGEMIPLPLDRARQFGQVYRAFRGLDRKYQ